MNIYITEISHIYKSVDNTKYYEKIISEASITFKDNNFKYIIYYCRSNNKINFCKSDYDYIFTIDIDIFKHNLKLFLDKNINILEFSNICKIIRDSDNNLQFEIQYDKDNCISLFSKYNDDFKLLETLFE